MQPILAVDELGRDPDALARLADAAFQDRGDVEAPAHLLHVGGPALVGEYRIARDDGKARDLREIGDDVLGDAIGEILLLRIAAHVVEGQDGDRGLFLYRRPWLRLR